MLSFELIMMVFSHINYRDLSKKSKARTRKRKNQTPKVGTYLLNTLHIVHVKVYIIHAIKGGKHVCCLQPLYSSIFPNLHVHVHVDKMYMYVYKLLLILFDASLLHGILSLAVCFI